MQRSSVRRRVGLTSAVLGLVLAVVGLVASPASAKQDGGEQGNAQSDEEGSANPCDDTAPWTKVNGSSSGDVLTASDASLSWTASQVSYSLPAGATLDLCIKSGEGVAFTPAPHVSGDKKGTWNDLTGSGSIQLNKDVSHVAWAYTPPVDVCPNLPGNQASPLECLPQFDFCPGLAGVQTTPADCPPDACPNLEGVQAPGTNCNPVVEDACPDLPEIQEPGTDCTPEDGCDDEADDVVLLQKAEADECDPEIEDACPNMEGVQESATQCPVVIPPAPQVVTTPAPDASIAECAVNGGPGILVTLRNTGTADAVFTVGVDGAPVGDAETLTVTPAEGTETISISQGEDQPVVVQISATGFSTELTLAGNCEEVLSVGIPAEPAAEAAQPAAEVAGVQHTRVLARTGASNGMLLVVAGLLLTLGGLSLYGSSRLRFDR